MLNEEEMGQVKFLSIDGVAPSLENIKNDTYPFTDSFYAITVSDRVPQEAIERKRMENTRLLVDWIRGEQGQSLVEATGYIRMASDEVNETIQVP